jgi:radical SAM superfamily enzyme YgiQ (UPF0313 family)
MQGVLLVNPVYEYKDYKNTKKFRIWRHTRVWQPLDLAIAGALLEKKGWKVKILDLNASQISKEEILSEAKSFDKIFITSGSLDRWQCPHLDIRSFIETVHQFKEGNPSAKIYIFGPHVTMRPKEMLEETKATAALIGEPECTILDVSTSIQPISAIQGVAYLDNGDIKFTQPRLSVSMSELPSPAFHLLDMDKYHYEIMGDHFTLLETTRGCPYQCTFCPEDQMYGKRYRFKPMEMIEQELDTCVNKYGVKNIYFIDLEFTLKKDFVHEVCDLIIKKGYKLNLACQTRADTVDMPLLQKMRKAGFTLIHYGLESGSPRILESTNKRITLETISQGVQWAKQVGMEVVCFSMMGLPTETVEDMDMTVKFAQKLNPDFISFHVATPYPGTKFHEAVKDELKGTGFHTSYNGMYSEEFIKRQTRNAYLRFYLRPSYLLSRLKKNPRLLFNQFKLFLEFVR